MPRSYRGALRDVLAAGGQRAVSRFMSLGAGPGEVGDYISERYPDLSAQEQLDLLGHAQSMVDAADAVSDGNIAVDEIQGLVPMNVRMNANADDLDATRYQTTVIVEWTREEDLVSGTSNFIVRHDQIMSAEELENLAAQQFLDMANRYPDWVGNELFGVDVIGIWDMEASY